MSVRLSSLNRSSRRATGALQARSLLALAALAACSTALQPQYVSPIPQDSQSQPMGPVTFGGPKDEPDRLARLAMAKRLNVDRQKQMTNSTDRLLHLAADLKAETVRAETDPAANISQSAASVKKAEEIAKLAHNIRQKMAEDYSSH